jgi:hypothetical protein
VKTIILEETPMLHLIGHAATELKDRTVAAAHTVHAAAKPHAAASQPAKAQGAAAKQAPLPPAPAKCPRVDALTQKRLAFEESAFQREMAEAKKAGFRVFKSCAAHYQRTFASMDARAGARIQLVQSFCPPRPVKRPWGTQIEQPSANLGTFASPEATGQQSVSRPNLIDVRTRCIESAALYSCCAMVALKGEGVMCYDRFDAQPPH